MLLKTNSHSVLDVILFKEVMVGRDLNNLLVSSKSLDFSVPELSKCKRIIKLVYYSSRDGNVTDFEINFLAISHLKVD